jgi:hypothetical protein
MATRTPPGRKEKPVDEPFDGEAFFAFLREIGPQPELADAIEKAHQELHRVFPEEPRRRSKRRLSTPKS